MQRPRALAAATATLALSATFVAATIITGTLIAGCGGESDPSAFPPGPELASEAAAVMAQVDTAHLVLELDHPIGGLPITRAEGDLTRQGDAKGAIQLAQGNQIIEVEFVVQHDGDDYLKYPTGGWQATGLISAFYDPSAVLDPERGVAKLLQTSSNQQTVGEERVTGRDTWRVNLNLDRATADTIVPGVPDGLTGTVWVDKETKHLVKAVVNAPASASEAATTITITLTNINAPVTVDAP